MNRKQRVLTVIALVAFVVIGACHYVDWGFHSFRSVFHTHWKELTYKEAQQEVPDKDFKRTFNDRLLGQGGYTDANGQWQTYVDDDIAKLLGIPPDAKLWFPIEAVSNELVWNPYFRMVYPNSAMIPDVRMPWFMLGVIYVGLFFLLADKKEKRQ
jgi:hypothetical protein